MTCIMNYSEVLKHTELKGMQYKLLIYYFSKAENTGRVKGEIQPVIAKALNWKNQSQVSRVKKDLLISKIIYQDGKDIYISKDYIAN